MNEYQRQAYLNALGVDYYVPRWRLPLAPEPVACELPVLVSPENDPSARAEGGIAGPESHQRQAQPHTEPEALRREPAPASVDEVLKGMSGRASANERSTAERAAAQVAEQAEPPREKLEPFTLSIWRSPLPLLVLDARVPRAAMPTDRLLRNILQAVQPHEAGSVREEVLAWPSVHNPAVHLRVEDAQAELHTWLEIELAQRPVRQLLLMGEKAARFYLPEGTDYRESLWQNIKLEPFNQPALIAPSLLELLREPLLKRDLWRALQPLLPLDAPANS